MDDVGAASEVLGLLQRLRLRHLGGQSRGIEGDPVAGPVANAPPEFGELRAEELVVPTAHEDLAVGVLWLRTLARIAGAAEAGRGVLLVESVAELREGLVDNQGESTDPWVDYPVAGLIDRQPQAPPDLLAALQVRAGIAEKPDLKDVRVVPAFP